MGRYEQQPHGRVRRHFRAIGYGAVLFVAVAASCRSSTAAGTRLPPDDLDPPPPWHLADAYEALVGDNLSSGVTNPGSPPAPRLVDARTLIWRTEPCCDASIVWARYALAEGGSRWLLGATWHHRDSQEWSLAWGLDDARSQVLLFDRPPTNADVDTLVAIIGMGEEPQIVVEGTVRPRTWEAVLGAPPPERWKGRGP